MKMKYNFKRTKVRFKISTMQTSEQVLHMGETKINEITLSQINFLVYSSIIITMQVSIFPTVAQYKVSAITSIIAIILSTNNI